VVSAAPAVSPQSNVSCRSIALSWAAPSGDAGSAAMPRIEAAVLLLTQSIPVESPVPRASVVMIA